MPYYAILPRLYLQDTGESQSHSHKDLARSCSKPRKLSTNCEASEPWETRGDSIAFLVTGTRLRHPKSPKPRELELKQRASVSNTFLQTSSLPLWGSEGAGNLDYHAL